MQIVKYNKVKEGVTYATVQSSAEASPSSQVTVGNRNLWGNSDGGSDITNSMQINGNIYLRGYDPSEELDDEDGTREGEKEEKEETIFPPEDEDPNGSIFADGDIFGKNITAEKDVYAKEHLYVNNPYVGNSKTDVMQMLYNYGQRFIAIENRLDNIESTLSTHTIKIGVAESNIISLRDDLNVANQNITRIDNDMTQLEDRILYCEQHLCSCDGSGDNNGEGTTTTTDITELTNRVSSLEDALDITDATVSNLNSDILSVGNRVTALENGIGGGDSSELVERVQDLESVTDALSSALDITDATVSNLNSDLLALTSRVTTLENNGGGGTGLDPDDQNTVDNLQRQVTANSNTIANHATRLQGAELDIINLRNQLNEARLRLDGHDDNVDMLDGDITSVQVNLNALTNRVSALEDVTDNLDGRLSAIE